MRIAIQELVLVVLCLVQYDFGRAFLPPTFRSKRPVAPISLPSFIVPPRRRRTWFPLILATDNDNNNNEQPKKKNTNKKQKKKKKKKKPSISNKQQSDERIKEEKKRQVRKAAAALRKDSKQEPPQEEDSLLGTILDPFKAGKKLRTTLNTALTTIGASTGGLPKERRSVYYVDDRFSEPLFSERNPLLERMEQDGYIPEVLVIGATGEVGRLVVRRLLLDGRFRVRVLVRDLYSKTLNLLGTGVTYCQGDLNNVESLEYALTDVDKIVFCAGAPRPDEDDFQDRFQLYCRENLNATSKTDLEWEELSFLLKMRAQLANQVDCIGMQNLVRAYQNVRHADYGTSQAAKRSLFKFQDRPEDFNLFSIDNGEEDEELQEDEVFESESAGVEAQEAISTFKNDDDIDYDNLDDDDDEYEDVYADEYEDEYADYDEEYGTAATTRKGASVQTQCQWIRNKFEHGVFVGKVSKGTSDMISGEAAIISSRLRSREEPSQGIDLSNGFAGFVCRVCSDGGRYEAFVRSGNYETDGIEYVCEFTTEIKPRRKGNKSRNKFKTVRLPFENFQPVQRREVASGKETVVPPFRGQDVRRIGFRYRSGNNPEKAKFEKGDLSSFYLAFCYIKVYRSQPEPEFVYLSDSRIPPVVRSNMVRHDVHQLVTSDSENDDDESYQLLDQAALTTVAADPMARCVEETYYKFRGEEILKSSGLSYTIIRICGFNEMPSGEASTIDLRAENEKMTAVSRAEVAQVCAEALLDSNALNKSIYMRKTKRKSSDLQKEEDLSSKFASVPTDVVR